jgi:drug/metabolite transporter (DMT)-like permease
MRIGQLAPVGLVVFWSSGFVGADLGTRTTSAVTLLAWRYVVALAVVAAVAAVAAHHRRSRAAPRASAPGWTHLGHVAVVGILCQAGFLLGVVGGVALGVDAALAALVAALQPLIVAVLAHALLGDSTGTAQQIGLGVGVVGVALVVLGDVGTGTAPAWAYLLPVAGTASLSVGTVLAARRASAGTALSDLTTQTAAAGLVLIGVGAATGQLVPPPDPAFWVAVAWVVVLSTAGGYGCYLVVLRDRGPRAVSVLLYLTPPVTALWAWLQLGETPGPGAIPGAALCVLAVLLAARTPSSARTGG